MAATAAGDGVDDDNGWEICNDHGFVYKRRRGLHPPDREEDPAAVAAPSSTPGPPPEVVLRRRRRQALLRLRAKYLDELSRWEFLSSGLLAPLPAPQAAPPRPPSDPVSAAPPPDSSSSDLAVVDDLLSQAEATEELLKKLSQACDEINEFCRAHEAALVDAVAELPVWGDPRELMNSLCRSAEQPDPGRGIVKPVYSPKESLYTEDVLASCECQVLNIILHQIIPMTSVSCSIAL
ncbi:uncharacterized protein LOC107303570 [Oryza brachyantha]|uniref:uncharacterized protein LOC107303570 n=1 Tax=Oryza brachyantha TaxID=4533 RepID=UPI001ADA9C7E|nr:uncharacterized protein LOC107303570 [Oryza brachyantha]